MCIRDRCREIIRRTEEELLLQVWEEDLPQIEKDLKELEEKDVRLGLVFFGEEEKKLPFRQYCRHGMLEDKKKEMGGRFITLVSDNKEVVFGQIVEEHTAEVIWSPVSYTHLGRKGAYSQRNSKCTGNSGGFLYINIRYYFRCV